MGVYTNIGLLNANDPEFLAAKNGTPEQLEEWEGDNGTIQDRPGAIMSGHDFYEETEDEYGGWLIKIADLPKEATHIIIHRG